MRNYLSRGALLSMAVVLSMLGFAGSSVAGVARTDDRAVINFADIDGIRNWRAEGRDAILIEGRNKRWFRATFFGPCIQLPWEETIAFVTDPTGSLTKFSSIIVGGERCHFRTLEEIAPPLAR